MNKIDLGLRFVRWAFLLGAGISVAVADAAAATKVGVTSAVNPAATGRPPQSKERILTVGVDMQANERVRTGATGRVQLLFEDGSAMTIGPNSDLVIDEFVYDPKRADKPGKLAFTVVKGVFRFVGGRISKQSTVKINTPGATLGIRGGVAIINATLGKYILLFGCMDAGSTSFCRPGFAVDTLPDGSLSQPRPTTPEEIRNALALFQASLTAGLTRIAPAGGGTGGQQQGSIDGRVASSGISQANSDLPPGQAAQSTALLSGQDYYNLIANRSNQTVLPPQESGPEEEIKPPHKKFRKFRKFKFLKFKLRRRFRHDRLRLALRLGHLGHRHRLFGDRFNPRRQHLRQLYARRLQPRRRHLRRLQLRRLQLRRLQLRRRHLRRVQIRRLHFQRLQFRRLQRRLVLSKNFHRRLSD